MIETLISSKTRIKLLLKFFLNSNATSYLRGLETEFGESTNAIRIELNRLEKAGMLDSFASGNKKYFKANTMHPLYQDIHNLILKYTGLDRIMDTIIDNLGDLHKVFVTGKLAQGLNSDNIDLVFVGNINHAYLLDLIEKVQKHVTKKVSFTVLTEKQFISSEWEVCHTDALLLWKN